MSLKAMFSWVTKGVRVLEMKDSRLVLRRGAIEVSGAQFMIISDGRVGRETFENVGEICGEVEGAVLLRDAAKLKVVRSVGLGNSCFLMLSHDVSDLF